jgi:hypothetical protein
MDKELINTKIKIHILDNGCSIKRMAKVVINILEQNKEYQAHGKTIK